MNTASLMFCILVATSFQVDKPLNQESELWSQIAIVYSDLNPGNRVDEIQTHKYLKELDAGFIFTEADPLLEPWMSATFESGGMERDILMEPGWAKSSNPHRWKGSQPLNPG